MKWQKYISRMVGLTRTMNWDIYLFDILGFAWAISRDDKDNVLLVYQNAEHAIQLA